MLIAFLAGLIAGAGLTVLLALAALGVFTLWRVYQAHHEAKAREARIMAAVAREQAAPILPAQTLAFPWLTKSRMD